MPEEALLNINLFITIEIIIKLRQEGIKNLCAAVNDFIFAGDRIWSRLWIAAKISADNRMSFYIIFHYRYQAANSVKNLSLL